jgi:hypothetical protein
MFSIVQNCLFEFAKPGVTVVAVIRKTYCVALLLIASDRC